MPIFTNNTWSVGQAVVVVGRGRLGEESMDGEIVKVGRTWVTVKTKRSWESRFDFSGRGESTVGYRDQLWPSRQAYEAHYRRRDAWRELGKAVDTYEPPEHLSIEDIIALIAAVRPDA